MTGTSLSKGKAAAQPGHGADAFQRPLRSRFQAQLMPSVMRLASILTLIVLSLGGVGYAIVAYGFFPFGATLHPDMRATFEAHSLVIKAHIFASVVALSLGPFQFSTRLRTARAALRRWLGRLYLGVGVVVGGLAGLFMATHAFGGLAARLGFACLAIAWLYTGLRAYGAIRARDFVGHRRWMVRNFSLTFAAVVLRLYLPASIASGVAFEVAYPIVAWLCWLPNLVVAELLLNQTHNPSIERQPPASRWLPLMSNVDMTADVKSGGKILVRCSSW
jgi:uncharacterized membrane protein